MIHAANLVVFDDIFVAGITVSDLTVDKGVVFTDANGKLYNHAGLLYDSALGELAVTTRVQAPLLVAGDLAGYRAEITADNMYLYPSGTQFLIQSKSALASLFIMSQDGSYMTIRNGASWSGNCNWHLSGFNLYFGWELDSYLYSKAAGGDGVVAMVVDDTETILFHKQILQVIDGSITTMTDEYTTDPGFDDASKWDATLAFTIVDSTMVINGTGSCANKLNVISGRDYVVKTGVSLADGLFTIKMGGSVQQTVVGSGTTFRKFTSISNQALIFNSTPDTAYTVTDSETYLMPEELSRFGDVEVWGELTVGMALTVPSARVSFSNLTVQQAGLGTDSPPEFIQFHGSDRGVIGGVAAASDFVVFLGTGNTNNTSPTDSGAGGSVQYVSGHGGDSSRSGYSAGAGGFIRFITGTGGTNSNGAGSDGDGGDFIVEPGAKGGTKGAVSGKFIIRDSSEVTLLSVEEETGALAVAGVTTLGSGLVLKTTHLTAGGTTLDGTQHTIYCNTDSAAFTLTLDTSPVEGQTYRIINTGSNGFDLTIDPQTLALFGSVATDILADSEAVIITYNTTEGWW